jgi:hypothetical protein
MLEKILRRIEEGLQCHHVVENLVVHITALDESRIPVLQEKVVERLTVNPSSHDSVGSSPTAPIQSFER